MVEKWADIKGYENKYQISNLGRIKSLQRETRNRNGKYIIEEKIMKPMVATNGYLIACLWKNNKQKKLVIHRLVAEAFIPNHNNYNEVNHIDEDKTNNNVNNLEWCSHKYNMNYGNIKNKISISNSGKTPNEETRKKIGLNSSNSRWINNGNVEKFVQTNKIDDYIKSNWKIGRLKRRLYK